MGWKNIENPGGKCETKSCGTGKGPYLEDECKCDESFKGIDCELCQDSDGCIEAFGEGHECYYDGFKSFENLNIGCKVKEDPMIALIGSVATFQMRGVGSGPKTEFPNVVNMQTWSFNDTTGYEGETFWCNLYNCTMEELPRQCVQYHCISSYCECNDGKTGNQRCINEPEMKEVVAHMIHSSCLECDQQLSCNFKHSDFPASILMDCDGSECVSNN